MIIVVCVKLIALEVLLMESLTAESFTISIIDHPRYHHPLILFVPELPRSSQQADPSYNKKILASIWYLSEEADDDKVKS